MKIIDYSGYYKYIRITYQEKELFRYIFGDTSDMNELNYNYMLSNLNSSCEKKLLNYIYHGKIVSFDLSDTDFLKDISSFFKDYTYEKEIITEINNIYNSIYFDDNMIFVNCGEKNELFKNELLSNLTFIKNNEYNIKNIKSNYILGNVFIGDIINNIKQIDINKIQQLRFISELSFFKDMSGQRLIFANKLYYEKFYSFINKKKSTIYTELINLIDLENRYLIYNIPFVHYNNYISYDKLITYETFENYKNYYFKNILKYDGLSFLKNYNLISNDLSSYNNNFSKIDIIFKSLDGFYFIENEYTTNSHNIIKSITNYFNNLYSQEEKEIIINTGETLLFSLLEKHSSKIYFKYYIKTLTLKQKFYIAVKKQLIDSRINIQNQKTLLFICFLLT